MDFESLCKQLEVIIPEEGKSKHMCAKERLTLINDFLSEAANRETICANLEVNKLETLINLVFDYREAEPGDDLESTPLSVFFAHADIRSCLLDWGSTDGLSRLVITSPFTAYQYAKTQPWALPTEEDISKPFFSNIVVVYLFISHPDKATLFNDRRFASAFESSASVASELIEGLKSAEAISLALASPIICHALNSTELAGHIRKLPNDNQVQLMQLVHIQEKLCTKDKEALVTALSEANFVHACEQERFLSFLPKFNFIHSAIFDAILAFSDRAKHLLLCNANFIRQLKSAHRKALVNSLASEKQAQLLRARKIVQRLKEQTVLADKWDNDVLFDVLGKASSVSKLSSDEFLDILSLAKNHAPQIMTVLGQYVIHHPDKLDSDKVAELIALKFSAQEIFIFFQGEECTPVFESCLNEKNYLRLIEVHPELLSLFLQVESFIPSVVSIRALNLFLKSDKSKVDADTYFELANDSKKLRKPMAYSESAASILSIANWIMNDGLTEKGLTHIFEIDLEFVRKANISRWIGLFERKFGQVVGITYFSELLLRAEEENFVSGEWLIEQCKHQLTIEDLAKLLSCDKPALVNWLLIESNLPKCLQPNKFFYIYEYIERTRPENNLIVAEKLLRIKKFRDNSVTAFERMHIHLPYLKPTLAVNLVVFYLKKQVLKLAQWQTILNSLEAKGALATIDAMLKKESLVASLGAAGLAWILNKGWVKEYHLASYAENPRLNRLLTSDQFNQIISRQDYVDAKQIALQSPTIQYAWLKNRVFASEWDNKAVKFSLPCIWQPSLVPHHIEHMRQAFRQGASLNHIQIIAKNAIQNTAFFLWNTRRREVDSFYHEIADMKIIQPPKASISDEVRMLAPGNLEITETHFSA